MRKISCLFAILLFSFLFACNNGVDDVESEKVSSKNTEEVEDRSDEISENENIDLSHSVNEFIEHFNKKAEELELPFQADENADIIETDEERSLEVVTDKYVRIELTLDKSGEIVDIFLFGEDDESKESVKQIVNAISATIAGAQPELSEEERNNILEDLDLLNVDELPLESSFTIIDDIEYGYSDMMWHVVFAIRSK